jgi:hypothetical protein
VTELTVVICFCSCNRFEHKKAFKFGKNTFIIPYYAIDSVKRNVLSSMFVSFCLLGGLKYIALPRLFCEYMLTFRVEEPMKICVIN